MGYDHHRHSVSGKLLHQLQHLAYHLRVQRRSRLIEEYHVRIHSKGPYDRDPLLLPAGQGRRIDVRLIFQADPSQKLHRLFPYLTLDLLVGLGNRKQFFGIAAAKQIPKPGPAVLPLRLLKILTP